MASEKLNHSSPRVFGIDPMVDFGSGIIEESVISLGINVKLHGFSSLPELLFEGLSYIRRNKGVFLAKESQDGSF